MLCKIFGDDLRCHWIGINITSITEL